MLNRNTHVLKVCHGLVKPDINLSQKIATSSRNLIYGLMIDYVYISYCSYLFDKVITDQYITIPILIVSFEIKTGSFEVDDIQTMFITK